MMALDVQAIGEADLRVQLVGGSWVLCVRAKEMGAHAVSLKPSVMQNTCTIMFSAIANVKSTR